MKTFVEKRILAGMLLLLAGIILMLKYYNILPWELPGYVFSWKSLLVLLGLIFIITERNKSTGIILFLIGSIFIAGDITGMQFWEVVRFVIPVVLIVAGLAILLRKQTFSGKDINQPESTDNRDYINDVNIFGGGEKKINSMNFKGGQLTAIFGGSEIDLRNAEMAEGINAIDVLCIFGGTSIRVPEGWEVKSEITSIFGGYSDERITEKTDEVHPAPKVLYLKGMVLFGGVELK